MRQLFIPFFIFSLILISGCGLFRKAPIIEPKEKKVTLVQPTSFYPEPKPFVPELRHPWVDSVYSILSEDEKLGQLFMIAAYSNQKEYNYRKIDSLIINQGVGGLIFFQGGPLRQAILTNRYQKNAKVPLMIAIDGEWGLGMRLDSTINYPRQMTLGAIPDSRFIYSMAKDMAQQFKRLGIHVNFAPVVDININPANPVIGDRAFGEDKEQVMSKGYAYMMGLQKNGIIANAKHFPGHGDTGSDSHYELPVIKHSKARMDSLELYPFKKLTEMGLMSMMVAHLHIPAYDTSENSATTISKYVVTGLLKKKINFKGLIFTDALNMKAVSKNFAPGILDVKALLAGNDVLLFSENVPKAVSEIKKAIAENQISWTEIEERVRKILYCKYWSKVHLHPTVELSNLNADLNKSSSEALVYKLYEEAMTLVSNKNDLIPIRNIGNKSFAAISIGISIENSFLSKIDNYVDVQLFSLGKRSKRKEYDALLKRLKKEDIVIVGLHKMSRYASRGYGISEEVHRFLKKLNEQNRVILVLFGSPYSLKYFNDFTHTLVAYEDNEYTRSIAPQILFGGLEAHGFLPVSANSNLRVGTSVETKTLHRLKYGMPELAKMDSRVLSNIDTIVANAIRNEAMPGCQIVVIKDGYVVHEKNYGFLTYDSTHAVNRNTLYDIASLTKVTGTLQAIMYLKDRGDLDLDQRAGFYLKDMVGTNKDSLIIRDILTHQARLTPYENFWKRGLDEKGKKLDSTFCSLNIKCDSCIYLTQNACCASFMADSVWKWILESDLKPKNEYLYSDFGFYIMKRIAEKLLQEPIDVFLEREIYSSLGTKKIGYTPLRYKSSIENIAPTENDTLFRKGQICGTVHDPGAAMTGGVEGHAGLFSNAHDLALILQMNLQDGVYGGKRYFKHGIINEFAAKQFQDNRRGLGWDKKEPSGNGPTSDLASENTFGHSGFTGTCAWIDPDKKMIFIFLSNRVFPSASNRKLISGNVRTRIMDVIYQSMME